MININSIVKYAKNKTAALKYRINKIKPCKYCQQHVQIVNIKDLDIPTYIKYQ